MQRKNMGDLKDNIAATVSTSKEIVQDKCHDIKTGAQNGAKDIKKGTHAVGRDVKQTAVNVSRGITSSKPPHQTERINRTQS